MKKTIVLGLVLFLLAGLSLGVGSWAVNREREAVTVTEEVLLGDSAAGAGITISTISTAGDHLTWRTDYTLGGDCRTTFSSEEGVWRQLREYTQQNFYVSMNLSYGFSGPVDSSYGAYGNDKVVRPIVEDLLKDMSPGDVKTEKVRLADYTDVYPFRLEGEVMGVYVEGDDAIQKAYATKGVPSCIVLDTCKGKGATFAEPKHDHSSQPSEEQWAEAIAASEKALEEIKNA